MYSICSLKKWSCFRSCLCTYEPIPAEDTKKAMKLYTEASAEDCESDTRMENLTEALALDPYPSDFYTAILDFFSDERRNCKACQNHGY